MKLHFEKTPRITPSNASTALVDLSLDYVAMCGEGANSRADIIFRKRKENVSMPKTFEELLAALQPEQADLVTKHIAGVEAAKDTVIKGLNEKVETLNGTVETLQKSKPVPADEDVMKSLSPEVQAVFKKQQETIASLMAAQADELAKTRFEKIKAIPCEEATLKEVLKTASPAVYSVLEKAATAITEGLQTAKGRNSDPAFVGTSANDQYDKLEKSARAIMATDSSLSFEQAFTQACIADPDAYGKYVEGVK